MDMYLYCINVFDGTYTSNVWQRVPLQDVTRNATVNITYTDRSEAAGIYLFKVTGESPAVFITQSFKIVLGMTMPTVQRTRNCSNSQYICLESVQ